jgi:CDGSH-type Zn-finger protein
MSFYGILQVVCVRRSPEAVTVEAAQTVYFCTCGKSAKQPMCDGSHKGTKFSPLPWTAPRAETVQFCMCKQSRNLPFCDGTHERLPETARGQVSSQCIEDNRRRCRRRCSDCNYQ